MRSQGRGVATSDRDQMAYLVNRGGVDLKFQGNITSENASFQCFYVPSNVCLTLQEMAIVVSLRRFNVLIR
jgi:hypothetical protein